MVSTDRQKITDLLIRGTEDIIVKEELEERLLSGEVLRVKFGIDPTGPTLHLGRVSVLRKLKAFQDLGHQIVIVIGDFTAQIGDASDKTEKRPMLSRELVNAHFASYKEQIGKVLDIEKVEFVYNSEWLDKLGFQEISELAECFSVQQMSARRNFKDRLASGDEISLREFLYPLMQGYDSVMVRADVELGGFDQLFNLKAGRVLQKKYGQKEQSVMTTQMLEGTDGRKMSTSWGNVVTILDEPQDMYGKIMAVRDELLINYFVLATDIETLEIQKIEGLLADGENPKNVKMRLAREIVTLYHGAQKAQEAEDFFVATFSQKEIPLLEAVMVSKEDTLVAVLWREGIVVSKADFSRLVEQGAIEHLETKEIITEKNALVQDGTYRIGKKRFILLEVKK